MNSPKRSSPVEGTVHNKKGAARLLETFYLVDLVEKLSKARAKSGGVGRGIGSGFAGYENIRLPVISKHGFGRGISVPESKSTIPCSTRNYKTTQFSTANSV